METAAVRAKPKVSAKVALVGIPADAGDLLRDCFRQFKIESVSLEKSQGQRLKQEKFAACVVLLDEHADLILETVRNSPSNSRVVVYGITSDPTSVRKWARYCVNAVFLAPVERQSALRVVRSTYLLVLHEFRRYVRLPIVSELTVETSAGIRKGDSVEVSAGGMSVRVPGLKAGEAVMVKFDLPKPPAVTVAARVCWVRAKEQTAGLRFDTADSRRFRVKEWIEEFLEL